VQYRAVVEEEVKAEELPLLKVANDVGAVIVLSMLT
jgi:hypothetical protein